MRVRFQPPTRRHNGIGTRGHENAAGERWAECFRVIAMGAN